MMLSETATLGATSAPPPNSPRPESLRAPEVADASTVVKKVGGLVLTRHLGESIMIGEEVEVVVVEVRPSTVKLKILAPRSVAVHRMEVFEAIRENPA